MMARDCPACSGTSPILPPLAAFVKNVLAQHRLMQPLFKFGSGLVRVDSFSSKKGRNT